MTSLIPPGALAIVPTIFNNTPEPNCYYNFTEMSYKPKQNIFVVPVLKIFVEKIISTPPMYNNKHRSQ